MNGFLGTQADIWSDLSFTTTILFGLIGIFGGLQAHRKKFSTHCPVMAAAALLSWLPILFVMVPTWINLIQGEVTLADGIFSSVPIVHGIIGGITQLLLTYTVTRMYWIDTLPPKKPLWLMRIAITIWLITILGGIGVYLISFTG